MTLTKKFNARVLYVQHSNPPILGVYSEELGHSEISLSALKLSPAEVAAFDGVREVTGTYQDLKKTKDIYAPGADDPFKWDWRTVKWKATSVQPKA